MRRAATCRSGRGFPGGTRSKKRLRKGSSSERNEPQQLLKETGQNDRLAVTTILRTSTGPAEAQRRWSAAGGWRARNGGPVATTSRRRRMSCKKDYAMREQRHVDLPVGGRRFHEPSTAACQSMSAAAMRRRRLRRRRHRRSRAVEPIHRREPIHDHRTATKPYIHPDAGPSKGLLCRRCRG